MLVKAILLPVFIQVALTFVLLLLTGSSRVRVIRSGEVRIKDIALGQQAWPLRVTQLGNAFNNQFQLPLLLYTAVIIAIVTRQADIIMVALTWVFVAARLVHALIHTNSNHVPTRFNVFLAGSLVLMAMWIYLAFNVLTAGA